MIQAPVGSQRTTVGGERVHLKLARRHDLPGRVQGLLHGVFGLCRSTWPRFVDATIDEFARQLFRRAEKTRAGSGQHEQMQVLQGLRAARPEIVPRFLAALEDALAGFDKQRLEADGSAAAAGAKQELSLLDSSDLEETLAIQDLAVRIEIRHTTPLHMLGHRFGVMAHAPALDATALPIGPFRLGEALRHAVAPLALAIDDRVLLYQTFDRIALSGVGAFYDEVNAWFVEQRVLPNLRVLAHAAKGARSSVGEASTPARRPEPAERQPAPAGAAPPPVLDERDSELFSTLRELLAGRRHALGYAIREAGAEEYVPSSADVQAVLGALQSMPVAPAVVGGRVVPRAVSQLKHDMLARLRSLAPPGAVPQLAGEDSDTVDLVGMLFDRVMQDIQPNSATQTLLTRLQVPLLRVALGDKGFFTHRDHPARQLLNAIAETGSRWADDGDSEESRALVERMRRVIDRVTSEFDGDLGLIENLLNDLSQHMRTLARRAEVSERRHVDAAKGREKLAIARQSASAEIAARIAAAKPSPFVRTLLEQAWADVLALTLLRHGEGSEHYRKQLDVVDRLIGASAAAKRGNPAPASPALRARIASSLSEIGLDREDVHDVVGRLFVASEADAEDGMSRTELAMKLKLKPHLGSDAAGDAKRAAAKPKRELSAEETRTVEQLKSVPFGTWFEFTINQQGERARRKLSWYSPLTGHCLFVNARGARAEERTFEQLARDIVRGEVRFAPTESDSIVDRAWRAIVDSLRQLAGRGVTATVAA